LPIPRTKLDFNSAFLLLLAGDVSVNPGPITQQHKLRIGTINARSMRDKAPALHDLVLSKSLDVLAITETWLTSKETSASLADMTPPGFSFHQIPRAGRAGGGVGIFVSDSLSFTPISIPVQSSFEAICGTIKSGKSRFTLFNLYRPPGSDKVFSNEIQEILSMLATSPQDLIITGDFNLHVDVPSKQTDLFLEILSSFDLQQHVNFPTHIHSHSLDLLIASATCSFSSVFRSDRISDHFTVIAEMKLQVPARSEHKTVTFRNLKAIDLDAFRRDIRNSDLLVNPADNATDLANQYNSELRSIMDRHAPVKSKRLYCRPENPWMTPAILEAKRHRRYLERTWRRNPTPLNRSRLTKQTHFCNRLMSKAKSAHYSDIIRENSADQRSRWKAFNTILHRKPVPFLPDCSSLKELANKFGSFFIDKISMIRASFPTPASNDVATGLPGHPDPHQLTCFSPVTETDVKRLIVGAPTKSCDLDPIPTQLLKSCIDVLLTPITKLINLSLSEGVFPSAFKTAHVTPLLKKPSLCKDDMKNYRPVSNLSFISKLVEKVVASRIRSHIDSTGMSNCFQSAYKKLHSTETALLKIHNDVLTAMDKGKVTVLTLLDMSAAFDTIDHSILLQRLEKCYGFSGTAICWLKSYLTNRCQRIKLDSCLSPSVSLPFGVPQGSVLGPLLFTVYTSPLSSVIEGQSVPHHLYADDTQLYLSFSADDSESSILRLQQCLGSVQHWMLANKLKLNPDKTEFLLIGHERQRKKYLSSFPIPLLGVDTKPAKAARNLGVYFDQNFNFRKHISQVCGSCYYHIRDLRRIRRHLSLEDTKCLATALVSSRLDYCNSLLQGLAAMDTLKLQRVQNCLARVVSKSGRFAASLPLRRSLHWLPVSSRIEFKISLLTYKVLSTGQPSYLSTLISRAAPSRTLRSNKGLLLSVPRMKTKTGDRAFSACAPTLWNKLPLSVRSSDTLSAFRKHLKTHLFGLAYPP
jgi:hypothetical protein